MPKFRTIFLTNSEKSSLEMHFVRAANDDVMDLETFLLWQSVNICSDANDIA